MSQLQDLMAKAEFLKKNAQCIPAQWRLAWMGIQKHLGAIRKQVKIAQGIFDDMALDVTEIPRLYEIIETIAKICEEFQ